MAILDEICARIIGLSEAGNTRFQIAAIIGVSVRTFQKFLKTFREDGSYKCKPCGGSHTKKLSERDVHSIVRYSKTHCRSSVSVIINICPTQVCKRTIQRILHKSEFFSQIAVKKGFLIPRHMSQRLAFAQKYRGWNTKE